MLTDDKNLIEIYQDYIDDEGYVQRYNYDKGRYYNTGTCLRGPKGNCGNPGRPGKDGLTPRINQDNGHWMIGDVDTGVMARGGQSDWNQNDNTKLDYIKNKPTISSGSVILNDSYGAFDLSVHNAVNGVPTTYADLSAALTALNALDSTYKKPGMSFRFVRTSDNKYIQCRYMSSSTAAADFTNTANWQEILNSELEKLYTHNNHFVASITGSISNDGSDSGYVGCKRSEYIKVDSNSILYPHNISRNISQQGGLVGLFFYDDNKQACANQVHTIGGVVPEVVYLRYYDDVAFIRFAGAGTDNPSMDIVSGSNITDNIEDIKEEQSKNECKIDKNYNDINGFEDSFDENDCTITGVLYTTGEVLNIQNLGSVSDKIPLPNKSCKLSFEGYSTAPYCGVVVYDYNDNHLWHNASASGEIDLLDYPTASYIRICKIGTTNPSIRLHYDTQSINAKIGELSGHIQEIPEIEEQVDDIFLTINGTSNIDLDVDDCVISNTILNESGALVTNSLGKVSNKIPLIGSQRITYHGYYAQGYYVSVVLYNKQDTAIWHNTDNDGVIDTADYPTASYLRICSYKITAVGAIGNTTVSIVYYGRAILPELDELSSDASSNKALIAFNKFSNIKASKIEGEYFLLGRWFEQNGKPTTVSSGSEIWFKVKGSSTISFELQTVDSGVALPYYAYQIDGGTFTRVSAATSAISLPDTNEHFVRIVIDSMIQGAGEKYTRGAGVFINNLSVNAGTMTAYAPNCKVGLFFGDSITEGIRALGQETNDTPAVNSAINAFPFICASNLRSVTYRAGYGNSGVFVGGSFTQFINAIDYIKQGLEVPYIEPDYIVINHGTNDTFTSKTAAEFEEAYQIALERLVVKYTGTPIFCVLPPGAGKFHSSIESAVGNTPNCFVVDTTGWSITYTDGLHPSAAGAKTMGDKLSEFIMGMLGKSFFM